MSRRYPQGTVRQRREHLQRCVRCDTSLHGGTGSNLAWHQIDGKWKVGPMCLTCTTTRDLAPNPNYKLRPELYSPP